MAYYWAPDYSISAGLITPQASLNHSSGPGLVTSQIPDCHWSGPGLVTRLVPDWSLVRSQPDHSSGVVLITHQAQHGPDTCQGGHRLSLRPQSLWAAAKRHPPFHLTGYCTIGKPLTSPRRCPIVPVQSAHTHSDGADNDKSTTITIPDLPVVKGP